MASLLGAFGDIHGDFAAVRQIMLRHPEVRCWVSVGDVADEAGRYEPVPAPLYWIKGNNENFDAIAAGRLPEAHRYLPDAEPQMIDLVRVVGLGGTFAPTSYDTPAADLPHPQKGTARATAAADKRRHFVRADVERCKALRNIDLLLTHEAPRPFRVGRLDAGRTQINEVLAAVRPRLHLFGHHHRFAERETEDVRSVGLDPASMSYLLIDEISFEYERVLVSTGVHVA
jgi:uncharacterized protein